MTQVRLAAANAVTWLSEDAYFPGQRLLNSAVHKHTDLCRFSINWIWINQTLQFEFPKNLCIPTFPRYNNGNQVRWRLNSIFKQMRCRLKQSRTGWKILPLSLVHAIQRALLTSKAVDWDTELWGFYIVLLLLAILDKTANLLYIRLCLIPKLKNNE